MPPVVSHVSRRVSYVFLSIFVHFLCLHVVVCCSCLCAQCSLCLHCQPCHLFKSASPRLIYVSCFTLIVSYPVFSVLSFASPLSHYVRLVLLCFPPVSHPSLLPRAFKSLVFLCLLLDHLHFLRPSSLIFMFYVLSFFILVCSFPQFRFLLVFRSLPSPFVFGVFCIPK